MQTPFSKSFLLVPRSWDLPFSRKMDGPFLILMAGKVEYMLNFRELFYFISLA